MDTAELNDVMQTPKSITVMNVQHLLMLGEKNDIVSIRYCEYKI